MREHEQLADCFPLLLVIILICSSEDARRILQAAVDLGLDTGEFVFILLQQLEVGLVSSSVLRGDKNCQVAGCVWEPDTHQGSRRSVP